MRLPWVCSRGGGFPTRVVPRLDSYVLRVAALLISYGLPTRLHASQVWEDKVLTSSSKYNTLWLNVVMSGMWAVVVVLVLWRVAAFPSGMNAIYLSFVIYSTFNHKEEVRLGKPS